ncbi:MAG: hypothetical protein PHY02_09625 [Phycisphaerae bacterium]|nr:hypothetical protein [Phycisphaerae bacterium]
MSDDNKMTAITAHMEGESVIEKNLGKKHKISDDEIEFLKNSIREIFTDDKRDGLERLSQSCTAILTTEKFEKYIYLPSKKQG